MSNTKHNNTKDVTDILDKFDKLCNLLLVVFFSFPPKETVSKKPKDGLDLHIQRQYDFWPIKLQDRK